MTDFKIIPAERHGIKPLIGLYGKSGGGKTHSALLLARGIVGMKGKIVLIDTENKRGHIFSDIVPNSYHVIDFDIPFSPERYIETFKEASNADIIVVDSMTHEWSGSGGVLDMQEAEFAKMGSRESCRMMSWIKPKMAHKKMVSEILRLPMPVICCLRGEEKTHSVKDQKTGKNTVVTDDFSTPLFDSRFIFEMLINGEVFANDKGEGGFLRIGKVTHPKLRPCLPSQDTQISVEHGKMIAEWCASPGTKPVETVPEFHPSQFDDELKTVTTGVAKVLKHKRGNDFIFRILGNGDTIYTVDSEELATLAKTAQGAGIEIKIQHRDDKFNSVVSLDLVEPE
jgi:hypothetical protein